MSCPVCSRVMCDCSPLERGQTAEEMMRDYERDLERLRKGTKRTSEQLKKEVTEE